MPLSITDFLEARIAEDEVIARAAAASNPGEQGYLEHGIAGKHWTPRNGMVEGSVEDLWDCEGSGTLQTTNEVAAHMARHDPARVLAECAVKREVIQRVQNDYQVLEALAVVYYGHPDYNKNWRRV